MTFSDAQLAQYRRDGYIAVPDLFTPREVAAMQAEPDCLMVAGRARNVATEVEMTVAVE